MKLMTLLTVGIISFSSFALTGANLTSAVDSAMDEASVEIELDTVEAFEAEIIGSEIEVKVLSHSHGGQEELLVYGCHLHGQNMACHEEGHHHLLKEEMGYSEMSLAFNSAFTKMGKTLARRGSSIAAIKSLKVWKHEEGHGDHAHGTDVWTKVVYDLNGAEKTTFIQCHQHEGEVDFACHYKRVAEGEPTLEDDHDHE